MKLADVFDNCIVNFMTTFITASSLKVNNLWISQQSTFNFIIVKSYYCVGQYLLIF